MKIGVSSWSMHTEFFEKRMDVFSFIKTVKETFKVDAVELVNTMIGENTTENLRKIKDSLECYDIKVLNMPIDVGNISQLDVTGRRKDIDLIKTWIDAAAFLGSKGARVNTGSQPEGVFDLSITISSYKELAEYAASKNLCLILENHGGMSADPANILKIFKGVNNSNFRVCPDFGNFAPEIRYEAIDAIFNNPALVHAKTYGFNEKGEEIDYDFGKCMDIAKSHNYDGYLSIEYEGEGNQFEGVLKTIELIKKYI